MSLWKNLTYHTTDADEAYSEIERIRAVRESGNVLRFHTKQTIKDDSVASHSWGVATLIILLHPKPSKELIAAALFHDAGELISGDTPYTSKLLDSQLSKSLKAIEQKFLNEHNINYEGSLTMEEHQWLKACDMLDLIFFCVDEVELGNNKIKTILNNGINAIRSRGGPPIVISIIDAIGAQYT